MPKPTYEFVQSPNKSRRTKAISAIVIHYTATNTIESPISWFRRADSLCSAHYLIGRDGRCVQMVQDDQVAWHAGHSSMRPNLPDGDPNKEPNVNSFSLGIELVGTADSYFTDKQMASLYAILEVLVTKYKIPPERVVGHLHVAPGRKIDPDGQQQQFNWQRTREVCTVAYQAVTGTDLRRA